MCYVTVSYHSVDLTLMNIDHVQSHLDDATDAWGIKVERVEM